MAMQGSGTAKSGTNATRFVISLSGQVGAPRGKPHELPRFAKSAQSASQMIDSTSRTHQQAATASREIEIIVSVEHTVARSRSMSSTRESFRSGSAWRWAKPMMADR
jgi:hypothetical protein